MLQLVNFQHFYCTAHIACTIISNLLQVSLTNACPHTAHLMPDITGLGKHL